MIGGLPGNPFVFVQFEQSGGVFEFAALALDALSLHFAEFVQAFLELAGETLALNAEVGEEAMGVDDVKFDGGLLGGWIGSAGEQVGFEERDAIEAPGGVGELLDELGFGGSGGSVFVEEAAAMGVEGRLVFGRKDGGGGGQAMAQRIQRGTLLTGIGSWSGGAQGIGAVNGGARRDWCS